ncbi:MAG: adenylyltransferase/cytidyltransferase family protein [Spirochaetales bacterium]|jgi:FAD synthetase|nr:adenylyltransferase/cytidyltransferase family protein [Spirochaetales bacterium]
MKRVLVFGTFDLIHPGHINFLRQARRRGRWLIVSIARDGFVSHMKKRAPVHTEHERLTRILETRLVKEAYLADEEIGTYAVIREAKPDIICLGHDQDMLKDNLLNWLREQKIEIPVVTLSAHKAHRYKSSKIRKHHEI